MSFVADTVHQMEATHPQAVGEMLAFTSQMHVIGPDDGICRSALSGKIRWVPRVQTAQLTEAFPNFSDGMPSAAGWWAISSVDCMLSYAQPYLAELPAAVLATVRAEPSGAVGLTYRRYVRTVLAPGLRRVVAILSAHGATIELT